MAEIEQLPGIANLSTTRDDDFSRVFSWQDQNAAAIDLTGYTFTTAIVTTDGEIAGTTTVTNASGGLVRVDFSNVLLTAIDDGIYTWYLKWITNTGEKRRVLAGTFTLQTAAA